MLFCELLTFFNCQDHSFEFVQYLDISFDHNPLNFCIMINYSTQYLQIFKFIPKTQNIYNLGQNSPFIYELVSLSCYARLILFYSNYEIFFEFKNNIDLKL